jgi:transaldolase
LSDEGGDAHQMIKNSIEWLKRWNFQSKIIVGSIRSVADILSAAMAGAHIITIPPELLARMADHKYTRATVSQFMTDAQKAQRMMEMAHPTGKPI